MAEAGAGGVPEKTRKKWGPKAVEREPEDILRVTGVRHGRPIRVPTLPKLHC